MYQLIEVKTKQDKKDFLCLPTTLYKDEKNWIRPLNNDIECVFDPQKNKAFLNGECARWILENSEGKIIGRVAAFIDYQSAGNNDQPTGGMGFFECINNHEAAFLLFDTCKHWLQKRGMEAMDGPVNFGDRDKWWGLLVDGFYEPNYNMPYNFPYYQEMFEAYGFRNYFNQYTYHRLLKLEGVAPEIAEKANRIATNPAYQVRHIDKRRGEKYAEDFLTIYNKGWAKFTGVKPITKAYALGLFKTLKPIMDENLMWFAYYNDEPVAFFIMIPEINQIVKHLNGNFNLWGKLKFLWLLKRKTCTRVLGLIFGVVPDHQGKGVENSLIMAFGKTLDNHAFPYKELELNWIGDFNPAMMKVARKIGAQIRKTHVTYRYLFDQSKEFKRAPKVNIPTR
ncbi:MAG: hypothetical protein Q8928_17620 [Bacteroidota bacterium]|nr:hypothetical protein [Bacteroidota bacterium]